MAVVPTYPCSQLAPLSPTAVQATVYNKPRRMGFEGWMTEATYTLTQYTYLALYLFLFHGNNGYANASECYVCNLKV
jgi:hypothetical protein